MKTVIAFLMLTLALPALAQTAEKSFIADLQSGRYEAVVKRDVYLYWESHVKCPDYDNNGNCLSSGKVYLLKQFDFSGRETKWEYDNNGVDEGCEVRLRSVIPGGGYPMDALAEVLNYPRLQYRIDCRVGDASCPPPEQVSFRRGINSVDPASVRVEYLPSKVIEREIRYEYTTPETVTDYNYKSLSFSVPLSSRLRLQYTCWSGGAKPELRGRDITAEAVNELLPPDMATLMRK